MRRFLASAVVISTFIVPAGLRAQAAPAAPTPAPAHPNFSGTWVLDSAQSQSPMPLPSSMTVTVTQTADTMKIDRAATTQMGDVKSSTNWLLNGTTKNSSTQMGMAVESSTTTSWEGSTLVAKTTADVGGNSLQQVDHWMLSPDGKQITINTDISAGGQSMSAKLVLVKKS